MDSHPTVGLIGLGGQVSEALHALSERSGVDINVIEGADIPDAIDQLRDYVSKADALRRSNTCAIICYRSDAGDKFVKLAAMISATVPVALIAVDDSRLPKKLPDEINNSHVVAYEAPVPLTDVLEGLGFPPGAPSNAVITGATTADDSEFEEGTSRTSPSSASWNSPDDDGDHMPSRAANLSPTQFGGQQRTVDPQARRQELREQIFGDNRNQSIEQLINESRGGASRNGLAKVVCTVSGKGGVGKTFSTVALAQRAVSTRPDLKVVVVDDNAGQGDITTVLQMAHRPGDDLPTIYDWQKKNSILDVVIRADQINARRNPKLPKINFSVVRPPSQAEFESGIVTSLMYYKVIEALREVVDLVIIDTQIIDNGDSSKILSDLVQPLMVTPDSWLMYVTTPTKMSTSHMGERLRDFLSPRHGSTRVVEPTRVLSVVNQVKDTYLNGDRRPILDDLIAKIKQFSLIMGVIPDSEKAYISVEDGIPYGDLDEVSPVMDQMLKMIIGIELDVTPMRDKKKRSILPWRRRK